MTNDVVSEYEVAVEHPDSNASFTVLARSEGEAKRIALAEALVELGSGATVTWVRAK